MSPPLLFNLVYRMAKESFQMTVSEKDAMDVKVDVGSDLKDANLTDGQDPSKETAHPEKNLQEDKNLYSMKRAAEPEDCSSMQVHVLAVDDNFIDRKIIERLLKSASFDVISVDSGAKALEVLAAPNSKINLIVTDYCMPEMSGYDLLKHVKETPVLKEIPVVIVSSENVPSRIQRCLEEGAEEFMLKPVRLADVKRLGSYVSVPKETPVEQLSVSCKKRKFSSEGFQVQSPERGPRMGSVTVA